VPRLVHEDEDGKYDEKGENACHYGQEVSLLALH
jgi:hypothetical protein